MYRMKSGVKIFIGLSIVFYPFCILSLTSFFFFSLNNRISLLEDLLEHLVKNMDSILKRVENELRKSKKE